MFRIMFLSILFSLPVHRLWSGGGQSGCAAHARCLWSSRQMRIDVPGYGYVTSLTTHSKGNESSQIFLSSSCGSHIGGKDVGYPVHLLTGKTQKGAQRSSIQDFAFPFCLPGQRLDHASFCLSTSSREQRVPVAGT